MKELIQQIINNPLSSLALVGNLVIIESLLSVDNAAVLATMVMDLNPKERSKALSYGMVGAYLFRVVAMFFATILIKIWWLKPAGGLYLIYLFWNWWNDQRKKNSEKPLEKKDNRLYKALIGTVGSFWATVALIEVMDIAFSIDNVFAAVAFTPNIIIICTGVFIGILAIRFIAQWFVKLMEVYPFLETSAFIVIAVLGVKLLLSLCQHFYPQSGLALFLDSRSADLSISFVTICIFFTPIITSRLFNVPKKHLDSKAGQ